MKNAEQILNDYQQADEERRLSIYMTYRELRPDFDEIDRAQTTTVNQPSTLHRSKPSRSWTLRLCSKRLTIKVESC